MDMAPPNAIPDDLLINASDEIRIRQDLVLTALGHRPADRALRVGRLLDVHSRTWSEDQEIVFKGRRIVWVGPAGSYPGQSEPIHSIGSWSFVMAGPTLAPDIGYRIARALDLGQAAIGERLAQAAETTPASTVAALPTGAKLDAGVAKYLGEIGLLAA